MCGINGFVQFRKVFCKEYMSSTVHLMDEKIIHRGPNSEGLYADDVCALGMRRLSIIDLAGGAQPIWNESRDKLIVFNGELYNFRDLRKALIDKGHLFSTDSDTEVVLHGFEEYGTQFLKQMEGMFAFAIYDVRKKEWTIARDRIGEKPLYYYKADDFLLFGSELKSLLATGLVPRTIDKEAMSTYFQLTYIPAPHSILENVYKLMPASVMKVDASGNVSVEEYWHLKLDDYPIDNYEEAKRKLREALFASVERRMVSDVPLGAFLSGGFDSSIVVGIMSQLSKEPVNTFTIGFEDKQFDESPIAALVARKNKTNHHVLTLDWNETIKDLDYILGNIDEPFADSSLIATYAVSKMAREYVTVALTGDAGDELFAGYDKYLISYYGNLYKKVPSIIRNGIIKPASKLLPSTGSLARKVNKVISSADLPVFEQRKRMMSLGFKPDELKQLMLNGYVCGMDFIEGYYNEYSGVDEQKRAQYVDLKVVLEGDMLAKVDRASMLASLETRVPMLDWNVVELAYHMLTEFKIDRTRRKIILKETFDDLIPEDLYKAPKHGFGVPIGNWLGTSLKKNLLDYSDTDYLESQDLFNPNCISKMIDNHLSGKENRYSELWSFYVFQTWYEREIVMNKENNSMNTNNIISLKNNLIGGGTRSLTVVA